MIIGGTLGYFSAHWIISGSIGALTLKKSGWTLWSKAGLPDADPYTNAYFAMRSQLPLSAFEEMIFKSSNDTDGIALNTGCTYEVTSQLIPARTWSLAAVRPNGQTFDVNSGRASYNQGNIVRGGNGEFTVRVSASATSGNWLPISTIDATFALNLSLINPERKYIENPEEIPLPLIKQVSCR